jgi:hypothetical protein
MHNLTDQAATVFFILGLIVLVLLFIWRTPSRHSE